MLNEVGIMKLMEDHPNAVKLLEVYDEPKSYYLVMEVWDMTPDHIGTVMLGIVCLHGAGVRAGCTVCGA